LGEEGEGGVGVGVGEEDKGKGRKKRVWRSMRPIVERWDKGGRREDGQRKEKGKGKTRRIRERRNRLTSIPRFRHKVEHQRAADNIEQRLSLEGNWPIHEVLFGNERVTGVKIKGGVLDPWMRSEVVGKEGSYFEDSKDTKE